MDNPSRLTREERVRELLARREDASCALPVPPYSPDLNPPSRRHSRRSRGSHAGRGARHAHPRGALVEALVEAMGKALGAVSASDARGFFEHGGYRAMGQPF